MAKRVLIATIGSLGDLNPFIGIGRALKARGVCVKMAVPADQVARVRSAGLTACAVQPADMVLPAQAVAQRLPMAQLATVKDILVATLPDYARRLDVLAQGADAIVASPFVLAAQIVAEKRGILLVPALLQPFALPLPGDAPVSPSLWMLAHDAAARPWSRAWNRCAMAGVRFVVAQWLGGAINAVRDSHGLPAVGQSPFFTLPAPRALALYPAWFATDATAELQPTGFVRGARGQIDAEMADFLRAGPPPIVFTLGSLAGAAPGAFPAAALITARALRQRAVLITPGAPRRVGDVIMRDHIDYAALFPHASTIVHHGGVGTIADALAAGRPQIIVPHLGDQFDNAARVFRLGIGRTVPIKDFVRGAAVNAINSVRADGNVSRQIGRLGTMVRNHSGAEAAAAAIMTMMQQNRAIHDQAPISTTMAEQELRLAGG